VTALVRAGSQGFCIRRVAAEERGSGDPSSAGNAAPFEMTPGAVFVAIRTKVKIPTLSPQRARRQGWGNRMAVVTKVHAREVMPK